MRHLLFGVVVAMGLGACGSGGDLAPADACTKLLAAECKQLLKCTPSDQQNQPGFPKSQAECETTLNAQTHCVMQTEATTCDADEGPYDSGAAGDCIDDVNSLSCAEFNKTLDGDDTNDPKTACDDICPSAS